MAFALMTGRQQELFKGFVKLAFGLLIIFGGSAAGRALGFSTGVVGPTLFAVVIAFAWTVERLMPYVPAGTQPGNAIHPTRPFHIIVLFCATHAITLWATSSFFTATGVALCVALLGCGRGLRKGHGILKIWNKLALDEARKWSSLCNDVIKAQNTGYAIFVVAHFEETLATLVTELRNHSINFHRYPSDHLASTESEVKSDRVLIIISSDIQSQAAVAHSRGARKVFVAVAECYPTPGRDDALTSGISSLARDVEVVYYSALSDPVLAAFGTEAVRTLMQRLSKGTNATVEHPLVAKAIRAAQERIAKRVAHEESAESAVNWFRKNLPNGSGPLS